jgi:FkbM family methyltransferase
MIAEVVDYDAYQLNLISWNANAERHIIDIGANVGVTALVLSQIPGVKVTCYEPDPENCKLLQQNLDLNRLTNVKVFQAAVTNVNGTTEFQTDEESTGGRVASERSAVKRRNDKSACNYA